MYKLHIVHVSPDPTSRGSTTSQLLSSVTQGRRPREGLGGRSPQNLRWGDAHAFVPPIFGEVVLSDARESINRVKRCFSCEERVIYDI